MRAVIQRVSQAAVAVEGTEISRIGPGYLILLGVHQSDSSREVEWMVRKIAHLRLFEEQPGKLDRSVIDQRGEILVVSQFTLYADCTKGRRPGFTDAAPPDRAVPLYEDFVQRLKLEGLPVQTGRFGDHMEVSLTNDGPVTIVLDSPAVK